MTPERLAELPSALKMAFRDGAAWRERAPTKEGHTLPHQAIDEAAEFYVVNHPPIVQHVQSIKAEIDALTHDDQELTHAWANVHELEAENARLAAELRDYELLKRAVNEMVDTCDETCDSYGHSEACTKREERQYAEKIVKLTADVAKLREALQMFYDVIAPLAPSTAHDPHRLLAHAKRVLAETAPRT